MKSAVARVHAAVEDGHVPPSLTRMTSSEVAWKGIAQAVAPATIGDVAEAPGLGIVGTCALQQTSPGKFELTKMGVRETARGTGAGAFLLEAVIKRATDALGYICGLGADRSTRDDRRANE